MNIKVNNKSLECPETSTLAQLSEQLQWPDKGIAVAVNNRRVPRTEWAQFVIKENDSLVVIKAACGG